MWVVSFEVKGTGTANSKVRGKLRWSELCDWLGGDDDVQELELFELFVCPLV